VCVPVVPPTPALCVSRVASVDSGRGACVTVKEQHLWGIMPCWSRMVGVMLKSVPLAFSPPPFCVWLWCASTHACCAPTPSVHAVCMQGSHPRILLAACASWWGLCPRGHEICACSSGCLFVAAGRTQRQAVWRVGVAVWPLGVLMRLLQGCEGQWVRSVATKSAGGCCTVDLLC